MALDPIVTFNKLNQAYKKFLDSQFTFRDEKIDNAAKISLSNECEVLNGPYIQAFMPYEGSRTLQDLVNEGILNKDISKAFTHDEYSIYKRYNHQEKAIRLVNEGKSIIVASGTGSGKTECFFIPIINSILNELSNNKLCPGVRALIIYPMNALANDQMERLRESLKNIPEITFGRYIGETPQGDKSNILKGRKEAADTFKVDTGNDALDNELLTRAEMENNPPHILVTNYAMLEYMLLRSTSQKIFNGEYSNYFKFLVLDEAHTYKGAHGTEVSMLIRRLKETIFGKINNCLTCIGTSATLGGGDEEKQKVVEFAHNLFSEEFSLDTIIVSDRKCLSKINGDINSLSYYNDLFDKYENYDGLDKSRKLYDILSQDKLVYEIRKRIINSTITLSELADALSMDLKINRKNLESYIAKIIELCGYAISPLDNTPLINAKYHVFARTLEGGFITFADGCKIFTERRKEYKGFVVWELYNCMKCGQEYIEGEQETIDGDEFLIPSENGHLFMLSDEDSNISIDEDDSALKLDNDSQIDLSTKERYIMCPKCGKLFPPNIGEDIQCCGFCKDQFISLIKVESKNNCYKCGKFNRGTIRRLTTSEDTAIEMLTRKLYQLLPAEKTKNNNKVKTLWGISNNQNNDIPTGRKLLVFSDNRQEAARFAVFIQNRYNDWVWKNIIYSEIDKMDDSKISFKKLVDRCFTVANNNNLFYNEKSLDDKKDFAKKQILKEIIELEPRMSLNRLGMINIKIDSINDIDNSIIEHFCNNYNISRPEFLSVVYFFFDTLRRQGCVSFPEGIDHTDDIFEPRNFDTYFKLKGSSNERGKQVFGFIPSNGRTNKRLSYITNIFKKYGLNDELAKEKGLKFMEEFAESFNSNYFTENLPVLLRDVKTQEYVLNLDNIYFEKKVPTYVCKQCGETTKLENGICEKTNCGGNLVLISNNEDRGDYYRENFSNIKIIPMNAKEHTAQISSQTATGLQHDFKDNNVNILSCSTTFEMGVDIGSLESVVLRNVPPETANYIQRAGRAGRRGASAAFILTFAKRRSHDLTYYNDPRKMINGEIKAPYIDLNNAYLVRRHIHSMVFSYLSKIGYDLRKASDLICLDDELDFYKKINSESNINIILYNLLKEKPRDLFDSIKKVVPEQIQKELGVDNEWSFVKKLVDNNNPDNKDACLDNAINNYLYTINDLEALKDKNAQNGKYLEAEKLRKVITTYNSKDYISFLAESNVLPRYGFPVYTVSLDLNTDDVTKNRIDLTRDLRMAITEYAPGAQVVANGKYWKPYALKRQPNREWPTYDFAICEKCNKKYFYNTALGVENPNRKEECCGKKLVYKQMVVPEFGFITQRSDKESKKLKNEAHYHSTSLFEGFVENSNIEEKDIIISNKKINIKYSPNGEMFIINGGTFSSNKNILGVGFGICEKCGFVKTIDKFLKKDKSHLTANGKVCTGDLKQAYLGHYFKSDALVIKLPINPKHDFNKESILYAIIEGASKFMEIDRREIGGAIWFNGDDSGINVTLFDTVPNGAGHVKRMMNNIPEILNCALEKVNGTCGCGEETCCYGCLRNYDNQIYHDIMSRGAAFHYLTWLIKE